MVQVTYILDSTILFKTEYLLLKNLYVSMISAINFAFSHYKVIFRKKKEEEEKRNLKRNNYCSTVAKI